MKQLLKTDSPEWIAMGVAQKLDLLNEFLQPDKTDELIQEVKDGIRSEQRKVGRPRKC